MPSDQNGPADDEAPSEETPPRPAPEKATWEALLLHFEESKALRSRYEAMLRQIEESRPRRADSLPGPKVFLTLATEDEIERGVLARFEARLPDKPGYFWKWQVTGALEIISGQLGIGQLSIRCFEPTDRDAEPITRSVLTDVPVTQIFAKARAGLLEMSDWVLLDHQIFPEGNPLSREPWGEDKEHVYQQALTASVTARVTDDPQNSYPKAAMAYIGLMKLGMKNRIYPELAALLGVSKRRARSLIEAALRHGYLKRAGQAGKVGYTATHLLKQWERTPIREKAREGGD